MGSCICNVIKLVSPNSAWHGLCEFLRLMVVVFGIFIGNCRDWSNVCTQHPQKVNFFLALHVCETPHWVSSESYFGSSIPGCSAYKSHTCILSIDTHARDRYQCYPLFPLQR